MITGAGGQLGVELVRLFPSDDTIALSRAQLDITNGQQVMEAIESHKPDLVVHAAAMTQVDACESRQSDAYRINVVGAWQVARASARVGAAMVYVSTNYVFNGARLGPYREYDAPAPLSAYGLTKWQGELAARQVCEKLYVVRTAWVYSRWRRNFVSTLLKAADGDAPLSYVGDQVANPTYARDLADAIVRLVDSGAYGVYHLVNEGATSWYGWATTVLRALDRRTVVVSEIPAADFARPAQIPANSELGNETARSLGITLRPWGDALKEYLRENWA